ncbi:hypothetical protein DPQ33_16215 [Oceanidesulfovibrio indonesiensis]|jgi:YHS domain-containing protein|uniref:YHS domain-containing protein n=1 Tax=Oceanidesulfovibrio indonesiensis TaxID=54767 RepID=A0A7M3MAT1_9BACT|nr:YHS domain-containing protein [Oceanidesulfovibrio indonesiensis]TVM15032.1 hypothetical protein DPQ33_16215 [Oceanidesulfovibrio indonesiensis]
MKSIKNAIRISILGLSLTLLLAATVFAKQQETCPVLGSELQNKEVYVDYEGKRIYFCCPGCDKQFLENPEKYLKEMEEKGIELEDAPKE